MKAPIFFITLFLLVSTIASAKMKPSVGLSSCYRLVCAVVNIHNQLDDKMENPVHDLISGLVVSYPAEMDAGEQTAALYEKRSNTATGSAFLLTYNVTSKMTKNVYARVSFLVSVPYSQDFYSNHIGVAVTFEAANPNAEPSFYKYYGTENSDNWAEAVAYHPVGISKEFKITNKNGDVEQCLKIVANIGNSHSTVVNIEVQQCDKEKSNNNNEVQGNGLEIKDDTEDQESKIQTKENKNKKNN